MVTTPDATVWGPPLMYHVGDPVTATNVQRVSCAACAPTQHLQKTAFGRLRARYVLCTIPVNCMTVFRVWLELWRLVYPGCAAATLGCAVEPLRGEYVRADLAIKQDDL